MASNGNDFDQAVDQIAAFFKAAKSFQEKFGVVSDRPKESPPVGVVDPSGPLSTEHFTMVQLSSISVSLPVGFRGKIYVKVGTTRYRVEMKDGGHAIVTECPKGMA